MTKFEMTQPYSATWPRQLVLWAHLSNGTHWSTSAMGPLTNPPVGETHHHGHFHCTEFNFHCTESNHQKSQGAAAAAISSQIELKCIIAACDCLVCIGGVL